MLVLCLFFWWIFIYAFAKKIHQYDLIFYGIALIISIEGMLPFLLDLHGYHILYPQAVETFFNAVDKGIVSTTLFVWVMFGGALSKYSYMRKQILICRGEISIIASFLILPHMMHYTYDFIQGWERLSRLSGLAIWSVFLGFVAGMVGFLIMLPLFVTSFRKIRKKMRGKNWKALQEYAYIFYALIYAHILFEWLSKSGTERNTMVLCLYSFIFAVYFILKTKRVLERRYHKRPILSFPIVKEIMRKFYKKKEKGRAI